MAEFNPNIADREMRDYTGSSRGAGANQAFEALFSGIGDTVTMGVQTADTYIQNKIEDEVRQEFDTLNTGMGLSVDSVPIELTRSADQLSRLAAAQSQGKISPEYYYANLSATLKGLRAKYPGYDRQVDEIVQNVTGVRPANAFRDALFNNLAESERAAAASADRLEKILMDPKNWAYLNEDEKLNPEKYGGNEGLVAIIRERASRDAQLQNEVERVKNNSELAEPLLNQRFNIMVSDSFGQVSKAIGFGDQNFTEILRNASEGGGFTPEQLSNSVAGIDSFIISTKSQLYQLGSRPEFSHLSSTKIREMVDAAVAPLENIKTMLQAGEYQKATLLASQLELMRLEDRSKLFQTDSRIRAADAIKDIAPMQAEQLTLEAITAVGSGKQWADAMTGVLLGAEAMYDEQSSLSTATQKILDNDMSSQRQKSDQILGVLNTVVNQIESGVLEEGQISSAILRNYTPTTEGDVIWGAIADKQKNALFTKMFSPKVTKEVFEKGSPEAQEAYIAAAINRFQSVPEFRAAAADLQSAIPLSEFANVEYDEKNNRLRVYVDPDASAGQKFINGTEMSRLKIFAAEFNKALGSIAPILEQTGENEVQAVQALLAGMGVDPTAEKQKSILGWIYEGISTVASDLAQPIPSQEEIDLEEEDSDDISFEFKTPGGIAFRAMAKNNRGEQISDESGQPVVSRRGTGLDGLVSSTKRGYVPDIDRLNDDLKSGIAELQQAWGRELPIVSAYRDPARNKRAGGAKQSQHMHGNAVDIDVSGLSREERGELITLARKMGFGGIGVYRNSLHLDKASKRHWGPTFRSASTPSWALAYLK